MMPINRMIAASGLGLALLAAPSVALAVGLTYYVDAATGDDLRSEEVAQNSATPWKTITKGVLHAFGGDTILVNSGTYFESVESKRDGWSESQPIILKAAVPGAAIIKPPAGTNGVFISHNYHTVDGFKVTGAVQGLRLGAHDGGGPVVGLLVQNNRINNNSNTGISVANGLDIEIAFNIVKNNGHNGISYSGTSSLIHDNVVHHNTQFGIYVQDGTQHQVYDNTAYDNGTPPGDDDNIKIQGSTIPPPPQTYHVDCGVNGDDTRTPIQAKDPAFPWKTITKGVFHAQAGSTVLVSAGTCAESVESRRDGTKAAPIVLKSTVPGGAIIQPPAGSNGIVISHHYHTIDGFKVTGAFQGLKLGPHEVADGPVKGLVVQNNRINNNSNNGIGVTNGVKVEIAFNTLKNNGTATPQPIGNGISYSGDSSRIHDNIVHHNVQFGIYVKDGVNHLVYDNTAYDNGTPPGDDDNIKILGAALPTPAQTYYVDCDNGSDAHTTTQAKNPSTPWQTIQKAIDIADGGDTVMLLPGACRETAIESQRDGSADAPITITAQTPGTVKIVPPSGNGLYIGHNYHTLRGLIVKGATGNGIQVGPHEVGGGSVTGVVIESCVVHHNLVTGLKFSKSIKGRVQHSVIHDNGSHGISYAGNGARIFNNLVHSNGCSGPGCGDYGISILGVAGFGNNGHKITSNTIYGNLSGGLRLSDDQGSAVFGIATDNIIMANPVGIKEQGGGSFTLAYNNVFGNTQDNYQLATSVFTNSMSVYPEFVDLTIKDFRLSRVASGQSVDSPCIDAGSNTADILNLSGRTAFTDNSPDVGIVDIGYHGTEL